MTEEKKEDIYQLVYKPKDEAQYVYRNGTYLCEGFPDELLTALKFKWEYIRLREDEDDIIDNDLSRMSRERRGLHRRRDDTQAYHELRKIRK